MTSKNKWYRLSDVLNAFYTNYFGFENENSDDDEGPFLSCEDAYIRGYMYNLSYPMLDKFTGTTYDVFCQFNPDRTGLAFLSRSAISSFAKLDLENLRTDDSYVVVRMRKRDGMQYDSKIQPVDLGIGLKFKIWVNTGGGLSPVANPALGHFLYLAVVPRILASSYNTTDVMPQLSQSTQDYSTLDPQRNQVSTDAEMTTVADAFLGTGSASSSSIPSTTAFLSNGIPVEYSSPDGDASNYFVFYVLDKASQPQNVDVDPWNIVAQWISTAHPLDYFNEYSQTSVLDPPRYMFGLEVMWRDAGCLISPRTNSSSDVISAALGLPFYMVDDCASRPCLSGAICRDGLKAYTCICPFGLYVAGTCVDDRNVAAGKTAIQSSTAFPLTAAQAIDADPMTCTSTQPEARPWWQVDLGLSFHVSGADIFPRWDADCLADEGCVNRLAGFYIIVSELRGFETPSDICRFQRDSVISSSSSLLRCDYPVYGRYVTIRRENPRSEEPLELCEVKVYTWEELISEGKPVYKSSADVLKGDFCDLNVSHLSSAKYQWTIDLLSNVWVDFIEVVPVGGATCLENSYCGRHLDEHELRSGNYSMAYVDANPVSKLVPSQHPGSVMRWYCVGTCVGRYVTMTSGKNSTSILSLDGCKINLYKKMTDVLKEMVTESFSVGHIIQTKVIQWASVGSLSECLTLCAVQCHRCRSVNLADADPATGRMTCQLNDSKDPLLEIASDGWTLYRVHTAICIGT